MWALVTFLHNAFPHFAHFLDQLFLAKESTLDDFLKILNDE